MSASINMSDVTPADLTRGELTGLAAKLMGLAADEIVEVAVVAQVRKDNRSGFAFCGGGDPADQGIFLSEALDFLTNALTDQLADLLHEHITKAIKN